LAALEVVAQTPCDVAANLNLHSGLAEVDKDAHVFVSERGGQISPIGFHRLIQRLGEVAKMPFPKVGSDLAVALAAALSPAILDCNGSVLDPTKFAQPLYEGSSPGCLRRR